MKILIILVIALITSTVFAANNPLEIINIKPAGTGIPTISATNRIFKAYPGIEYNIRPAVIGGNYPYTFALSGQPSGMTINTSTGVISWPSPVSNSGTITLTVTDATGISTTSQWVITVSTSGFIFVDSSYAGVTETGSILQPYKSINSFLTDSTEADRESIVYFRAGTYALPAFHPSYTAVPGASGCNLDGIGYTRPYKWIGYPGETVNINTGGNFLESRYVYFDSLNLSGFYDYGIRTESGSNYNTVRRCSFSNLTNVRSSNDNQGYFFTEYTSTGNYLVMQDNTITAFSGSAGIGSLYYQNKPLIEDNYIYGDNGVGMNGIATTIAYKANNVNGTIRHNKIISSNSSVLGDSFNSNFYDSVNTEICFNYFNRGTSIVDWFNIDGFRSHGQGLTYFYRNTVVGDIVFENIDGNNCNAYATSGGPWNFNNNVIINPLSSSYTKVAHFTYHYTSINTPQNCITDTSNLKGVAADNLIDANGLLTNTSYVGTYGWEIGTSQQEDHTPPTITPSRTSGTATSAKFAWTMTATDNVGVTSRLYCISAIGQTCSSTTPYTGAVPVYPGSNVCAQACDAANNCQKECANYPWPKGCK